LVEGDIELDAVNSVYCILIGRKSIKQISVEEINFLKNAGFFDETKIEYESKTYSLFEDEFITNKLLRVMLTPDLQFFPTINDENCIFLRIHKKKIATFENFANTFHLEGCIWTTMKEEGFSKLDFNYLNSTGAVLNQFKSKRLRFDLSSPKINSNIYEELKMEKNWYFRLLRKRRFYSEYRFRKINDFKKFMRWKWMAYWLPLSINADISNVFDMNRYLVEKVSTKLKVPLDADDVHEFLGIHVCQLIPDTLKRLFDHKLNKSSITLVAYRKVAERTYDQWYFDHENPMLMHLIYKKVQFYPNYFKSKKWYLEYLLKAAKLDEIKFEKWLKNDNLVKAVEEVEAERLKENEELIEEDDSLFDIDIKVKPEKLDEPWSEFKLKKFLEYAEI
jgi:hypothetical protein